MDSAKHVIPHRYGEHLPVVVTDNSVHTRTLYAPFISPPTPSPSPGPFESSFPPSSPPLSPDHNEPLLTLGEVSLREFALLANQGPAARRRYLSLLLSACSPSELLYISTAIAPMLTRDFLRELPAELALHTLSFVDDHRTLLAAASVSRAWRKLCDEEVLWRGLVHDYGYSNEVEDARLRGMLLGRPKLPYRLAFQYSRTSEQNRAGGGSLIGAYRAPLLAPEESGVVTSLALGAHTVVVGLANSSIQTFDVRTGKRTKSLKGHTSGVWAVCLVEPGGEWAGGPEGDEDHDDWVLHSQSYADDTEDCVPSSPDSFEPAQFGEESRDMNSQPPPVSQMPPTPPRKPRQSPWYSSYELGTLDDPVEMEEKPSDMAFASDGWGQSNTIVVSGGCDKDVRVWELPSGRCIYKLRGHTSTIRCLRVLHSRPIAVTGSRDHTLRVWDIRRGRQVRVLTGHEDSVRALDVFGNRVASGSYDRTCRLWDIDTGECLHVLRGHYHQIYVVVFDGIRIASAGLDTTVRVWDAETGNCLALLQGHTALVCQLQIDTSTSQLVTGGSDGRVITFSLLPHANFEAVHKIPAHDSSVTSLQIEGTRLVTAGMDGRVRVFDKRTGALVRELGSQSDSVWKVVAKGNGVAVCCRRNNRTVTEIWGFKPEEEEMQGLHQLFR